VLAIALAAAALTLAGPGTEIDLPGHPGQLAVERGRTWVAVYQARDRGLVVGVDPAANRVASRIRVRGSPFELEAGAGGLWATGNFTRRGDVLNRIDPSSERVVATVPLPGRYAGVLATGRRSVWVVVRSRRARGVALVRVDPGTNRVARVWRLPGLSRRYIDRIAVGREAVWLLALRAGARGENPGELVRFNPRAGRVTATIDARALTMGLGPGGLWVSGCVECGAHRTTYFARRIDTRTNEFTGPRIVKPGVGFGPVFAGRARVWFGGYGPSGGPIAFSVDPHTGHTLRSVELGSELYTDMAFDPRTDRLSVALATGSLLRVDLAGR
jgi:hypothetical protein